jgi:uracil-DNA glycosylase
MALGAKRPARPFAHRARHPLPNGVVLFDSYHCSRYNTNTRRLTEPMFREVFDAIAEHLGDSGTRRAA